MPTQATMNGAGQNRQAKGQQVQRAVPTVPFTAHPVSTSSPPESTSREYSPRVPRTSGTSTFPPSDTPGHCSSSWKPRAV